MREGEIRPSELQVLADQFEQRMTELKQHTALRPGETTGPRFGNWEDLFKSIETMVDQQLIRQHGSAAKIREAIKLVDEAIAEIGQERQAGRGAWPNSVDLNKWLQRVEELAK